MALCAQGRLHRRERASRAALAYGGNGTVRVWGGGEGGKSPGVGEWICPLASWVTVARKMARNLDGGGVMG